MLTQENTVLSQDHPILPEQPKQSNFLTVLLSVLLLLSVSIAGFFAYQTQKLVKELNLVKVVPTPATEEPTIEPVATDNAIIREKQKIEIAAKTAFVKKIGQEPTTMYGLSEDSLKIMNDWAFGVITVAPVGEGAGPGANYFLARKLNNTWDAKIEYTSEFKEWLKISQIYYQAVFEQPSKSLKLLTLNFNQESLSSPSNFKSEYLTLVE